jgi:hypothetical protein
MKTKSSMTRVTTFVMILAATLVPVILPTQALARQEVMVGSIAYSASAPSVIGLVSMANPGFEKTITYQFPSPPSTSFTTPFFLDLDVEGEDAESTPRHGRVLNRNFDTTVVMTNTSLAGVTIDLTFFDQAGNPINGTDTTPIHVALGPKATTALFVSNLLNP